VDKTSVAQTVIDYKGRETGRRWCVAALSAANAGQAFEAWWKNATASRRSATPSF
jgi:hypothetical protein